MAEAKYITLSQAMRDMIPLIELLTEISCIFSINCLTPQIKCKVFEDNESYIAITRIQMFSPRTQLIPIKYYHFRHYVDNKIVEIIPIGTTEQTADIFTKLSTEEVFVYIRR